MVGEAGMILAGMMMLAMPGADRDVRSGAEHEVDARQVEGRGDHQQQGKASAQPTPRHLSTCAIPNHGAHSRRRRIVLPSVAVRMRSGAAVCDERPRALPFYFRHTASTLLPSGSVRNAA